jgi:hypothetical protein
MTRLLNAKPAPKPKHRVPKFTSWPAAFSRSSHLRCVTCKSWLGVFKTEAGAQAAKDAHDCDDW